MPCEDSNTHSLLSSSTGFPDLKSPWGSYFTKVVVAVRRQGEVRMGTKWTNGVEDLVLANQTPDSLPTVSDPYNGCITSLCPFNSSRG